MKRLLSLFLAACLALSLSGCLADYDTPKHAELSLFPCPFCGGHGAVYAEYETPVGNRWRVFCPDCMAGIDPGWAQTRSVVCGLWNRRTPAERR